jgi:hypothetical protein
MLGQWPPMTVADNGAGVAPQDAAGIFGMFARANREHEGTGIGLARAGAWSRRTAAGSGRARRGRRQRVRVHAAALVAQAAGAGARQPSGVLGSRPWADGWPPHSIDTLRRSWMLKGMCSTD